MVSRFRDAIPRRKASSVFHHCSSSPSRTKYRFAQRFLPVKYVAGTRETPDENREAVALGGRHYAPEVARFVIQPCIEYSSTLTRSFFSSMMSDADMSSSFSLIVPR